MNAATYLNSIAKENKNLIFEVGSFDIRTRFKDWFYSVDPKALDKKYTYQLDLKAPAHEAYNQFANWFKQQTNNPKVKTNSVSITRPRVSLLRYFDKKPKNLLENRMNVVTIDGIELLPQTNTTGSKLVGVAIALTSMPAKFVKTNVKRNGDFDFSIEVFSQTNDDGFIDLTVLINLINYQQTINETIETVKKKERFKQKMNMSSKVAKLKKAISIASNGQPIELKNPGSWVTSVHWFRTDHNIVDIYYVEKSDLEIQINPEGLVAKIKNWENELEQVAKVFATVFVG